MQKFPVTQPITGSNDLNLGDFWVWAYSDVLNNRNRAIFAEFLVGAALGVIDTPRNEWYPYDLKYQNKKIEVKSSAYLQSWPQTRLSSIRFDIAKKHIWDYEAGNDWIEGQHRYSDCYVFCVYVEIDEEKTHNILDVVNWHFWIISTETINQKVGEQKTIGLSGVRSLCDGFVNYVNLKTRGADIT